MISLLVSFQLPAERKGILALIQYNITLPHICGRKDVDFGGRHTSEKILHCVARHNTVGVT